MTKVKPMSTLKTHDHGHEVEIDHVQAKPKNKT